jgi:DNA-binding LacI/PurR family transcriptional regulator
MANSDTALNRTSLNEQVAQRLLARIRSQNKPGDRLPSEAALAKQMGISIITLRESLSVLAHRGLIERRHGSGTYVVDPTASQWIAVVTNLDLSHPNLSYFHRRVAYLARTLLAEAGLKVRIYSGMVAGSPAAEDTSLDFPAAVLEDVKLDLLRAVITLPGTGWEIFRKHRIPVVACDQNAPYSVTLHGDDFCTRAVGAMAAQGCKTAAILGWRTVPSLAPQWEAALRLHAMTTRPEWTAENAEYSEEAAGWRSFQNLWRAIPEKPDCVIIRDDILFREVAPAILKERIDIPASLKVFTHYNKGSRMIIPFACTIYQVDPDELARELVSLCKLALSSDAPKTKNVILSAEIVERTTP